MSIGRSEVLALYRNSLRAAQTFETYNFRAYFYRRTRDRFRTVANMALAGDSQAVSQGVQEARAELSVMQRQGTLNSMFAHKRTVLEASQNSAGGHRRRKGE
ncbi:hypothetical protein GGH91_001826 [Coemansia sp. RSA 2671]|nr:hypothetical protein LPJ60_000760 [Coemansia sp. RSA 2675]KAJ2347435.1 hypothetical protein GGH91_001826 [Coemansia sp. RSA 2671]KAJ2360470.1 hypothetical protein H4S02_011943 [Coemansia sp. RSA 2611]KAJ2701176.1 hypothetical protein H4218_001597 [Coemansia sp. IMI 209128]